MPKEEPKSFDDRQKKSFDLAADAVKQLITLSTAVTTLFLTLYKDFFKAPSKLLYLVFLSVGFSLVSISAGCTSLLAMVGTIAKEDIANLTVYAPAIRNSSIIQIISFLLSMAMLAAFAIAAPRQ